MSTTVCLTVQQSNPAHRLPVPPSATRPTRCSTRCSPANPTRLVTRDPSPRRKLYRNQSNLSRPSAHESSYVQHHITKLSGTLLKTISAALVQSPMSCNGSINPKSPNDVFVIPPLHSYNGFIPFGRSKIFDARHWKPVAHRTTISSTGDGEHCSLRKLVVLPSEAKGIGWS